MGAGASCCCRFWEGRVNDKKACGRWKVEKSKLNDFPLSCITHFLSLYHHSWENSVYTALAPKCPVDLLDSFSRLASLITSVIGKPE